MLSKMSSSAGKIQELELKIPSNPELIGEVDRQIEDLTQRVGYDQVTCGKIIVAVNEAVKNAILHGNKCDKSKEVVITSQCSSELFCIHICDFGGGFDTESIPDPRSPDNLLKESGRGVLMIRFLMDQVDFDISDRGTNVTLIKYAL